MYNNSSNNQINIQVGVRRFQCSYFALLVITIACGIMLFLGVWQINRGLYKQSFFAKLNENSSYIPIEQALKPPIQNFNKVVANVKCDKHKVFLVDLQRYKKKLGYHVVIPCFIKSSENILLVNLGWVENIQGIDKNKIPKNKQVYGKIKVLEHNPFVHQIKQKITYPLIVQGTEKNYFAKILQNKVMPTILLLDKNNDIGFYREWHSDILPASRHFFYALQWFLFAIISASMFIYLNLRSNEIK